METFTVVIKSINALEKTRTLKINAEDTWLAHKIATDSYNELKEDIVQIKDSKNNEVYNLDKGFILE